MRLIVNEIYSDSCGNTKYLGNGSLNINYAVLKLLIVLVLNEALKHYIECRVTVHVCRCMSVLLYVFGNDDVSQSDGADSRHRMGRVRR